MADTVIDLVVFDLGGVMVRLAAGREDAAKQAGVSLDLVTEQAWRGWAGLLARYESGGLDEDAYYAAIAEASGVPRADAERLMRAWLCGPYEGLDPLLDEIDAAGVATACLSNTNATHWHMMCGGCDRNALPLHRLTHRFASHLIGAAKPDAAIYAHVESATGLAANAIAFFDDNEANIAAAAERGWKAHRVDPAGDPAAQVRDHLRSYDLLS